ncbi:hypothetical protein B0J12DRAFT_660921 [Macrophomina phaseolina]|uniref:Secreted protein n=1 Tax=Macrophomina phaseolina TaxID=35725 RepID=A0ABQ8GD10_9PEZI|nr:hypothetical protein B0J12DRAFT_660921 [Macrophomina phaseolina]
MLLSVLPASAIPSLHAGYAMHAAPKRRPPALCHCGRAGQKPGQSNVPHWRPCCVAPIWLPTQLPVKTRPSFASVSPQRSRARLLAGRTALTVSQPLPGAAPPTHRRPGCPLVLLQKSKLHWPKCESACLSNQLLQMLSVASSFSMAPSERC